MKITIGTKTNIYKTIGYTEDFSPVLWFKIGEMKKAIEELTNFYNRFHELLATGVELTDEEYTKFSEQFNNKALLKAKNFVEHTVRSGVMYEDKFFTFIRK